MNTYILITNPTRSRKWGFGYETKPKRHSTDILPPTTPDHEGTLKQIQHAIQIDHTYQSFVNGGTYLHTAWFYNGRRIIGVGNFTYPRAFDEWLASLDYEKPDNVLLQLAE